VGRDLRRSDRRHAQFFNFTDSVEGEQEWKAKVGEDTPVRWPAEVGGKGNAGVASHVEQMNGAISYVEYAYVAETRLTYTESPTVSKIPVHFAPQISFATRILANIGHHAPIACANRLIEHGP
jgi:hypothetical protein